MMPKVAVVYLAYNSRPYLEDVVASLEAISYPKDRIEFIIVDNNSPDNSAEMIREFALPKSGVSLPKVTFFPNPNNEGFAAGNNIGINHALLEGCDYVYLLNNDAKFHPDALTKAVDIAESDKAIGSVQSLMLLWQDPERVNSTGGMVHFLGFGFVRDNGRLLKDVEVQDGEEIAYASGAAVLYRASVLREVGLLDAFLFLYHEDLELGWRIRLAGYRNVLAKQSIVYHKYEFKRSISKFFWMERNRILVHKSHLKVGTLALLAVPILLMEIALIGFAIKGGWIKEKLLVYRDLLSPKCWKYVWKKRKESSSIRKVSDREIVRMFTGRIAHQETSNVIVDRVGNPLLSALWAVMKRLIVW